MDTEITDAVTEWQTVSVSEGYAGLHELAEEAFTGAVTAGLAWAFVLNGRVVGVFDGTIEDFEDAVLTAYRAPDPALALLYAMRETGGTVRAQYYTQDTSISEADRTLSAGSFTGYLELSENVLSGDYYVVYYGGRAMPVAHVGASNRLVTDDEAFELADDEVGIYEIREVAIDVVDIPDPPGASGVEGVAAGTGDDSAEPSQFGDERSGVDTDEDEDGVDSGNETTDVTFGASGDGTTTTDGEPETADSGVGTDRPLAGMDVVGDDDPAGRDETSSGERSDDEDDPDEAVAAATDEGADEPDHRGNTPGLDDADAGRTVDDARGDADSDLAGDEHDEVDVGRTDEGEAEDGEGEAEDGGDTEQEAETKAEREAEVELSDADGSDQDGDGRGGGVGPLETAPEPPSGGADAEVEGRADTATLRERLESTRAELEAVTAERDELHSQVDDLRGEIEQLTGQRDEQRERIGELEAEIRTLREELERLESQATETETASDDAPERLSATAAKEGTNLFVRYRSKGKPTLEKARAGEVDQETVVENLHLEYHTTFESDQATVDGQPYERFLESTVEWGFVKWVVEDLLYEIGRSGNRNELAELFDRIPEVDRVQFAGEVPVTIEEGTETRHDAERFDLVFWDSMGDPLFVANFNTSRSETSQSMVSSLIEGARRVGESKGTLGAAFFVTTSFYEPGALEAVSEATGGGLLSRSSRKSYVKLSRKQGYHLCLVEARSEEYHLSVPEL